ncbi:DUF1311 domain-containing protein [Ornithinibacillus sp. L9]|uniref:DUF1311 domain-containing protein n=1 Tax=Ornithinibacillus caprae TaxID=2678566 RepID=A0A6N8FJ74_9BACI|nr:lysozyme inhibitor LprI family protein [Ornithinibacillus caprae]MUK88344.1 DUF1311 domain-containing protein [Ornithinibacillus caprae]
MKNNQKFLMGILTVLLVILTACGNSSNESDNHSSNNSSNQNENGESSSKDGSNIDKNKTENSSEGSETDQINDRDESSNHTSTYSSEGESSSSSDNEVTEKEEYLQKLNEMEELDRNLEAETTILAMEEQEAERFKTWDEELNKIYGVLKEQLSTEQMANLREEQRNWIEHRDEAAKEASLKYKGGSTESLEYVATQATLTRERCYELVAKYMK